MLTYPLRISYLTVPLCRGKGYSHKAFLKHFPLPPGLSYTQGLTFPSRPLHQQLLEKMSLSSSPKTWIYQSKPHLVLPLPSSGQATGLQVQQQAAPDLHWQVDTVVVSGAPGIGHKGCVKNTRWLGIHPH